MIIQDVKPAPGGWDVILEIPNAYTNGASRLVSVYLTADQVRDRTDNEIAAITAELARSLRGLRGRDLDALTEDKAVWAERLRFQLSDFVKLRDWLDYEQGLIDANDLDKIPQAAVDDLRVLFEQVRNRVRTTGNGWRNA